MRQLPAAPTAIWGVSQGIERQSDNRVCEVSRLRRDQHLIHPPKIRQLHAGFSCNVASDPKDAPFGHCGLERVGQFIEIISVEREYRRFGTELRVDSHARSMPGGTDTFVRSVA